MTFAADAMVLRYDQLSPVLAKFLGRYGFDAQCAISLAGNAGSRRVYFRLQQGLRAFIVLVSPPDDVDFGRFLRLTQFYRLLEFPVPMVYCIDDAAHEVVLEDLGDERLYDGIRAGSRPLRQAYGKVIDVLVDLQMRCFQRYQECPDIRSRIFDQDDLLWETSYYRAQYLEGRRGLVFSGHETDRLESVFQELARRVDLQPKSIMHRDFQSQNLMMQNDGTVRVIDYQGSRLGSVYYDLASLLLDPYIMLPDEDIWELTRYYQAKSLNSLGFDAMSREFLMAGAQRVMQALGAYCFLSRVKGLTPFAAYVEPGERRLAWILDRLDWPELRAVLPA